MGFQHQFSQDKGTGVGRRNGGWEKWDGGGGLGERGEREKVQEIEGGDGGGGERERGRERGGGGRERAVCTVLCKYWKLESISVSPNPNQVASPRPGQQLLNTIPTQLSTDDFLTRGHCKNKGRNIGNIWHVICFMKTGIYQLIKSFHQDLDNSC